MNGLTAVALGVCAGALIAFLVMRVLVRREIAAAIEAALARETGLMRRDAALAAKTGVQRRVADTVGSWTRDLPFRAEDARFLGHPVGYVAFEGYGATRARAGEITGLTFIAVTGADEGGAALVRECVEGGRVSWRTLEIG
ncbi:MAG: hypothetical protein FJ034_05755 [Chloroflexi bacterium]|nr:hypothetical protein [Chloroflexota bacterium]